MVPVKKPQPTALSFMSKAVNSGFGKFGGLNNDLETGPREVPLPRVKLTPIMKLAIAEQEEEDRDDFKEVAECLEEIVTAACKG
jgi:hypothetical protein